MVILLLFALAGTSAWRTRRKPAPIVLAHTEVSLPHQGRTDEYAGSASCRDCHKENYESWHRSFHRTMTQVASKESVRAPFENITLELDSQRYVLQKRGDQFWVEMPDPDVTLGIAGPTNPPPSEAKSAMGVPRVWRQLSLVTGSHHMQAYWVDNKHGNQQFSFPFTYLFEVQRWVPRRTVFLRNPQTKAWAQIWNVGCIDCHATGGQPEKELSDLPEFDSRVAEFGIACEACHGPGGRHVRENTQLAQQHAHGTREFVVNPARLDSKRAADICGRCHSLHAPLDEQRWLREGETFHPGEELSQKLRIITTSRSHDFRQSHFWNDGMIRVSGRDYNGLIRSPCYKKGELSCISCHSMHDSSPTNQLATGMESNEACLQCHRAIGENLEKHTHHTGHSSGTLCYNCHMPYTTYGLLKAIRSHEITSPSMKTTLATGRPNACNLCHLDKTLDWTNEKLAGWYGEARENLTEKQKSVAASVVWALQGDAAQRALMAWHMGWPTARAAAGEDWLAPYLALLMQDDYPAVRYTAGRSLKLLPGFADLSYDYLATEQLDQSARAIFARWKETAHRHNDPALLLTREGQLQEAEARELLKSQNRRLIELDE
jgi:predicted CXXCH cytochrome family protein